MDQQVRQFVGKSLGILRRSKIATLDPPFGNPAYDATNELPNAVLAPGLADVTTKVFGDHNIRRQLRPGSRDFDIRLLEYSLAFLIADIGGSRIPLDAVKGIDAGFGESPRHFEPNFPGRFLAALPSALLYR